MRILYFLVVFFFGFCFSSSLKNNGTFGGTINGEGLVKLGRKLQKPMLTLIGMAIRNIRVNQAPCVEWTPWTLCDSTGRGYFGTQTRNRSCSASGADSGNITESNEYETKLCEGFCPDSYNLTNNGFCLKLNETRVTHDEAMTQCESDGGYLIHIDSRQKLDDIRSIADGFGGYISIDGQRKDVWSPWKYTYGHQRALLNWQSGYPRTYSNYLCLSMDRTAEQINTPCTSTAAFLCEILKD